eukprot:363926-Chlamydomonas_euryale.AAC.9
MPSASRSNSGFADAPAEPNPATRAQMREGEYISAVQCRKAYAALDTQLGDLKQIAEAVDMDGATPEQVVQSFAQLVTVLNNFVGTVPPKYQVRGGTGG